MAPAEQDISVDSETPIFSIRDTSSVPSPREARPTTKPCCRCTHVTCMLTRRRWAKSRAPRRRPQGQVTSRPWMEVRSVRSSPLRRRAPFNGLHVATVCPCLAQVAAGRSRRSHVSCRRPRSEVDARSRSRPKPKGTGPSTAQSIETRQGLVAEWFKAPDLKAVLLGVHRIPDRVVACYFVPIPQLVISCSQMFCFVPFCRVLERSVPI